MKNYQKPLLSTFGSVEELTRFSFDSSNQDNAFNTGPNSDVTLTGLGSKDSCAVISPMPGNPCYIAPPTP